MFTIAPVQRANIGQHFLALGLRGQGALINPFMNVDHAWMSAPTFPPHKHAGFSAISYVFEDSETGIDNRDSLGTHNLIRPGGMHWVTAGSGIVHQENPAEEGRTVHSLQIFVALAPDKQGIAPFVLSLEPEDIPVVEMEGAAVRVPLGRFGGAGSPVTPPTDVTMLDISLEPGAVIDLPIAAGETAFLLPVAGTVGVGGTPFDPDALKVPVFPAQDAGRTVSLSAGTEAVQVMLFAGVPF